MTSSGQTTTQTAAETAIALGLLRQGGDTRGPRLFKDLIDEHMARAPEGPSPPDAGLLESLAERLAIPPAERRGRIDRARARARAALSSGVSSGLSILTWRDDGYPELLGHVPDPPMALWVKGNAAVLARPAVAVIGSRAATPTGLIIAKRLAGELADAGLAVVSGMARGIDAAAHEGALAAGGATVAVLGCGADIVYPREHDVLAARIAATGAVVSEYPPGTAPLARHFPLRNRIISGLALAVLVVEASQKSGSLITARAALEQGRDVLAVPGSVAGGRYRGCHDLIKDGARLVETVDDILDQIGRRRLPSPAVERNSLQSNGLERTMARGEPYTVDDLALRTGRTGPDLLADLTALELAGRIRRIPGGSFVRLD